jgi:hypothetical protein
MFVFEKRQIIQEIIWGMNDFNADTGISKSSRRFFLCLGAFTVAGYFWQTLVPWGAPGGGGERAS